MTNLTRAKRLAEIFGWRDEGDGEFVVVTYRDYPHNRFSHYAIFSDESCLLHWLLRELPKRGLEVELTSANLLHEWIVTLTGIDEQWLGKNADPLLALVDCVVAAHADTDR